MLLIVKEGNLQIYLIFNLKAFGYGLVPGDLKPLSCDLCFVIDDHHMLLKCNNFKSNGYIELIAGDLSSDEHGKSFFLVPGGSLPFSCL